MATLLQDETSSATCDRVDLFGVAIHVVRMRDTLDIIKGWLSAPAGHCRYVVTPNVDHIVLLQHHASLRSAYDDAALVIADGWPVVTASRWLGKPLPERVPGSDLVPMLFSEVTAPQPLRVFLLGAASGVGERAAQNIHRRWTNVDVVGTYSPPIGFEHSADENDKILYLLEQTTPDLLVVGLGAPKQELWVHAHQDRLTAKVALCVGATIDFLAGEKKRAPRWMRRLGIEWLHRACSEPRRLVKRYARDAWVFPQLVWRERRARTRVADQRPRSADGASEITGPC